ncbi:oligosaccharide flippase family protein [Candidatus Poribacteria bacterium]|nr:oligosaccharide flippase family protein [Candidatus Poribacteria bacterium]
MSKNLGSNITKLVFGRLGAQVINLIGSLILTRLFSPEVFGVRQIFVSIAAILGLISCFRYDLSIPLGENDEKAGKNFVLSVILAFVFAILVLIIIPLVKTSIALRYKAPELNILLWFLPLAAFAIGFYNALKYWVSYKNRFGSIAWAEFALAFSVVIVASAFGLTIGSQSIGLIVGYVVGWVCAFVMILLILGKLLINDIRKSRITLSGLWLQAKIHKKFPIYNTWSALINAIRGQLPPMILGVFYSTTVVGYYSLGYRLIGLPTLVMAQSVAQVFLPAAAESYRETGNMTDIMSNIFKRLVQIGVFPIAALGILAPALFRIFGERWIEAGVYTSILSGYMLFEFIVSPITHSFLVSQSQKKILIWECAFVSSRLVGLFLGAKIGGPRTALACFGILNGVLYIILLFSLFSHNNVSFSWSIILLLKYIGLSVILLLPAGIFVWIYSNVFVVIINAGIGTIAYIYILYRLDLGLRKIVKAKLSGKFLNVV